ncbi:MAG: thioredoxin family protein [Hymenobacteraceae bacterium]|nr:thioredoxin family protein [Hymenobacteraceae bacterium]MDX5397162.1 thioredoxin family protein [Hymenobacteraceae bacterium]MDX5443436.1 thioredoxin family protein [Hymenobacteraceae bacterium]MDX5513237.1 thioredoxin family protein [Hymenobacteraceae bacterium]
MKILATFAVAFLVTLSVFAQGSYQLGQKVQNFTLKDASNKNVSLSDFANAKTVVLVFTTNNCPYSKQYENRLLALTKNYAGRNVQFVFVNPSVGLQDGGETLQEMAGKNYTFPYLADEGQKLAGRFGATKTPEVFVLHNTNGEFILKYKGAIDDNPQAENFVNEYYLKNAIDALLNNGNPKTVDRRATGCMIKKY